MINSSSMSDLYSAESWSISTVLCVLLSGNDEIGSFSAIVWSCCWWAPGRGDCPVASSRPSDLFFFQSVLRWSVAVSTICRHSSRVVVFLQAVARPKFRRPRSASIARSQVWLGLPAGRFQSDGTCRIHAARARWWSSRGELRAIWPKSRRRLSLTRWESGEQPVVLLTSAFDTWRVYK